MNFKEIIKKEWEKEFPNIEYSYEESLTFALNSMIERICTRVWNQALDVAADNAEADFNLVSEDDDANFERLTEGIDYEVYVLKNSILKFKL